MVTAIVLINAETNRIPDLAEQIAEMDRRAGGVLRRRTP